MRRPRRGENRYSGGGGGGGLISSLFAGDQAANPAFGATTPGDVDFTYSGDPSQAIAKYGTQNPFQSRNILQRRAGMPDLNAAYNFTNALNRAQEERDILNIPREASAKVQADKIISDAMRNRKAKALADYAYYSNASNPSQFTPVLSPEEYEFGLGATGPAMGIPGAKSNLNFRMAENALGQLGAEQDRKTLERYGQPTKNLRGLAAQTEARIGAKEMFGRENRLPETEELKGKQSSAALGNFDLMNELNQNKAANEITPHGMLNFRTGRFTPFPNSSFGGLGMSYDQGPQPVALTTFGPVYDTGPKPNTQSKAEKPKEPAPYAPPPGAALMPSLGTPAGTMQQGVADFLKWLRERASMQLQNSPGY